MTQPRRRFTLPDLMVLIAATAAGLAWYRTPGGPNLYDLGEVRLDSARGFVHTIPHLAIAVIPCMAAWTLGLLILRLRRPRPPLAGLLCRPGFLACLVAVPFSMLEAFMTCVAGRPESTLGIVLLNGLNVLVAWTDLAAAGRWNAEPGWIDRAGRIAGVYWISIFLLLVVELSFFPD